MSIQNIECPNCGKRLIYDTDETSECPSCGAELLNAGPPSEDPQKRRNATMRLGWVVLVCALIILVVANAVNRDKKCAPAFTPTGYGVYYDPQETFAVDVPFGFEMIRDTRSFKFASGKVVPFRIHRSGNQYRHLAVAVFDMNLQQELGEAPEAIAGDMIDKSFASRLEKELARETITRSGHPVVRALSRKSVTGQTTDGVLEVYVLPERSFVLIANGPEGAAEEAPIIRFFESFRATPIEEDPFLP